MADVRCSGGLGHPVSSSRFEYEIVGLGTIPARSNIGCSVCLNVSSLRGIEFGMVVLEDHVDVNVVLAVRAVQRFRFDVVDDEAGGRVFGQLGPDDSGGLFENAPGHCLGVNLLVAVVGSMRSVGQMPRAVGLWSNGRGGQCDLFTRNPRLIPSPASSSPSTRSGQSSAVISQNRHSCLVGTRVAAFSAASLRIIAQRVCTDWPSTASAGIRTVWSW